MIVRDAGRDGDERGEEARSVREARCGKAERRDKNAESVGRACQMEKKKATGEVIEGSITFPLHNKSAT